MPKVTQLTGDRAGTWTYTVQLQSPYLVAIAAVNCGVHNLMLFRCSSRIADQNLHLLPVQFKIILFSSYALPSIQTPLPCDVLTVTYCAALTLQPFICESKGKTYPLAFLNTFSLNLAQNSKLLASPGILTLSSNTFSPLPNIWSFTHLLRMSFPTSSWALIKISGQMGTCHQRPLSKMPLIYSSAPSGQGSVLDKNGTRFTSLRLWLLFCYCCLYLLCI